MDFQEFNRFFISDFNIDSVTAMRQNWTADTRHNRLEVPRHRYGLLLLTDYPAQFLLPDGAVLRGQPGDLVMLSKGAHYLLTFSVPKDAASSKGKGVSLQGVFTSRGAPSSSNPFAPSTA